MRAFFRGWRRKLGMVLLGMACGWSRSLRYYNTIEFPVDPHTTAFVVSTRQFVGVRFEFTQDLPSRWAFYECKADDTLPLDWSDEDKGKNPLHYSRKLEWLSEWNEFGIGGNSEELPSYWLLEFMVPYWSIAIPLTLLSAVVLLWKPPHWPKEQPNA